MLGQRRKRPVKCPEHPGRKGQPGVGPKVIGMVGSGPRSRAVVPQVAELLAERNTVHVITDIPAHYLESPLPLQVWNAGAQAGNREKALRSWLQKRKSDRRIVVDLSQEDSAEELSGMLLGCEEIVWLVEPAESNKSFGRLQGVLQAAPGLASRLHLAWVRQAAEPVARKPLSYQLAKPEFQLRLEGDTVRRRDLLRLRYHLERISLGLALGGGGARGAAHVGVLRALEKAGILIDHIAGTSMGAYIAIAHAFGFSSDRILDIIADEMAAPWKWRLVPGGGLAHMAYMYRNGGWRKRAKHHFGDLCFENLHLPTYTVTADLASGQSVVRHQGDAIEALMESINFPGLAQPILRDGMVLVDGGVLNNLPSNVVRDQGAKFVVAVDLAGKFTPSFGSYDAEAPEGQCPTAMQTIVRVLEVQMRAAYSTPSHAPDLLIAPETTDIGFTEYRRAYEIAERGEAAAEQALLALKKILASCGRWAT